jgi:hypothetical protein
MNLIEKLGLEKCKALDGMLTKHAVPEDWKISIINGMWHRGSTGFTHKDLRTAITDYECDHDWEDISSMGDTERRLICTYCSMKKSEPFGLGAHQFDGRDCR